MTERRRLAAILVADVVGYKTLVGRDAGATQGAPIRNHRAPDRQGAGFLKQIRAPVSRACWQKFA
jgi:hypothetical protein